MEPGNPTQSEMWEQDLEDAVLGNTISEPEEEEKEETKDEESEE